VRSKLRRSTAKRRGERRGPYMPVVLTACEEGGYAYGYHHGTIGYGVFTYALAKEFRKPQEAVRGMYLSPTCANA